MLTPAQYKALKAWPNNTYIIGVHRKTSDFNIFEEMNVNSILYLIGSDYDTNYYELNQPACDDAIREYEEAHNINQTKEEVS